MKLLLIILSLYTAGCASTLASEGCYIKDPKDSCPNGSYTYTYNGKEICCKE